MNEIASNTPCPQDTNLLIDAFRRQYPFAFDPFQEDAIRRIASGSSVIVSAPTGAGKTLIAEFAIFRALHQKERIAYTTPIKALSNQKYADFCRQFGDDAVGILTGDVQINSHAPVLVMTTEILRNMFYLSPPENLAAVVLDECHYMGNEGRGTVWEEIIINCPADVPLVALSATVSNVDEIAAWISEVHRPIVAIQHPTRPIPLQYLLVEADGTIVGPADIVRKEPQIRERHGRDRRPRRRHGPNPNKLILQLQARGWLPAIYFIFSRTGCETALHRFLAEGVQLIDPHRQREVEEAIEKTLLDYPTIAPNSGLNHLIFEGLRRGVGIHHAGILAAMKRLTEVLFERGLVQVVFATETMSLGLHMPAKSVVIENLRKRSDEGFRSLFVGELTQMAGRAGRRGIDPLGTCLIAIDNPETLDEALQLIRGKPEPIESRFRIGYSSAALLVQSLPDQQAIRRTIERSFGQFQNRKRIRALEAEVDRLWSQVVGSDEARPPCCGAREFLDYQEKLAFIDAEQERLYSSRRSRRRRRRGARASKEAAREEGRRNLRTLRHQLAASPCHHCPAREQLAERLAQADEVREALTQRLTLLAHLQHSYWDQFLRVAHILEYFDYLDAGVLSPEGRLIASLRHDNELLVARVAFSGILDDLTPPEVIALISCLSEESREAEHRYAWLFLRQHPHLQKRLNAMSHLAHEVLAAQQVQKVTLPVPLHVGYLAASHRWASGEDNWTRLVEESFGGHEGDLIRAFRRLIDLCRQLAESPEVDPRLQDSLWQGIRALDRGIVLDSALI